jgi:hypothetical protein
MILNGFGDTAETEKTRIRIEEAWGARTAYCGADMIEPAEIAACPSAMACGRRRVRCTSPR